MKIQLLKININKNRVFGLDILRELAIFFVVFGHGQRDYTKINGLQHKVSRIKKYKVYGMYRFLKLKSRTL